MTQIGPPGLCQLPDCLGRPKLLLVTSWSQTTCQSGAGINHAMISWMEILARGLVWARGPGEMSWFVSLSVNDLRAVVPEGSSVDEPLNWGIFFRISLLEMSVLPVLTISRLTAKKNIFLKSEQIKILFRHSIPYTSLHKNQSKPHSNINRSWDISN